MIGLLRGVEVLVCPQPCGATQLLLTVIKNRGDFHPVYFTQIDGFLITVNNGRRATSLRATYELGMRRC